MSSYVPRSLSKSDAKKQRRSIEMGTMRPKVKYRKRRSPWVIAFQKRYGYPITDDESIAKEIISKRGIDQILDKGRGAYFSSGSRPNQTPDSWARARLASVIMDGPARKVDRKIWDEFKR